jgi:Antibiotic biosynthesis monooxygenase
LTGAARVGSNSGRAEPDKEDYMSVLMVLRLQVDPDAFRKVADENADAMRDISHRGKDRGAIHHAFFAGDGEVLVVDEWNDAESFQAFFDEEGPNIGPLMESAGAQMDAPRFYEKVDTADVF